MCNEHSPTSRVSRRDLLRAGVAAMAGAIVLPPGLTARALTQSSWSSSPDSDLDVALRAERWIRTTRVETASGLTWPADPLKPASVEYDLYNGMPGVILFYLELYHATRDAKWLADVRGGANQLIVQLPAMAQAGNCGLYTGLAGAAFVLEEAHRATGDGVYRDAATRAIDAIRAAAGRSGGGVVWSGESATNDIISGSAGIGLFLLWADKHMQNPPAGELATAAGRRLIEAGVAEKGGIKWNVAPNVKNLYPNFSHGTAGVGYFLASLYQATGSREFLDASLAGARYLQAVANVDGDGFKVFHHEPGGESLYYLSWCHGPAGLSRFWYRLGEATGDEQWHGLVRRAATAIQQSGVPEQRTPGFWNNISQCCGNCGVGEYFLTLNRIMPNASYADMVRRVAEDTLRRSTANADGLEWVQAENRVQPDVTIAQTGFMQGAAGVGTFFLHKNAAQQHNAAPAIVWPDTPFGGR